MARGIQRNSTGSSKRAEACKTPPYGAAALCRMAEAKKKLGDMEATRDYCRKAVDKAWDDERMAVEVLRGSTS